MIGEIVMKAKDWSYNLEFEEDEEYIVEETLKAILETQTEHYVNIVTSGQLEHPDLWLIPEIKKRVESGEIKIKDIYFIAHCGCGGYVTRIYI